MTQYGYAFFDSDSNKNSTMSMRQVAKKLNIGPKKLFKILREKGILNNDNTPKEEFLSVGFFNHSYIHKSYRGLSTSMSCRVNEDGFLWIKNFLTTTNQAKS